MAFIGAWSHNPVGQFLKGKITVTRIYIKSKLITLRSIVYKLHNVLCYLNQNSTIFCIRCILRFIYACTFFKMYFADFTLF